MSACLFFALSLTCFGSASADEERYAPSSRGDRAESVDRSVNGVATWYGADFQGSPMADGVPYDMYDPTIAASNMYPLGTMLRVTRRDTGGSVVVKVSDRGAFRAPILVDLSHAAFSQLGDTSEGVIPITVEPLE
jgi:rare lipoprotein A